MIAHFSCKDTDMLIDSERAQTIWVQALKSVDVTPA